MVVGGGLGRVIWLSLVVVRRLAAKWCMMVDDGWMILPEFSPTVVAIVDCHALFDLKT